MSKSISKFPRPPWPQHPYKAARSDEETGPSGAKAVVKDPGRRGCGGCNVGFVDLESPGEGAAHDDPSWIQQLLGLPHLSSGQRSSLTIRTRYRSGAEPA